MENLTLHLKKIMDAFPAKTALYCVDLTTGTPIAAIRENTQVVSASTIKVPIVCCALQDVMEGKLSLEQKLIISPGDFCGDTRVFEPEYRQDGASLEEMLYWMIVSSDNTAANTVISLLGFAHINRYFRSLGLIQTRLRRKMLDHQAIAQGRNNYTSPMDLYHIFSIRTGNLFFHVDSISRICNKVFQPDPCYILDKVFVAFLLFCHWCL